MQDYSLPQQKSMDTCFWLGVAQQQQNPLADAFFSKANLDTIQNELIRQVYIASRGKYKIGPQSVAELSQICFGTYYEFATFEPNNIRGQVDKLNKIVIGRSVPVILTNLQQQLSYVKDASEMYTPVPLPVSTSSKGQNTDDKLTPFALHNPAINYRFGSG